MAKYACVLPMECLGRFEERESWALLIRMDSLLRYQDSTLLLISFSRTSLWQMQETLRSTDAFRRVEEY